MTSAPDRRDSGTGEDERALVGNEPLLLDGAGTMHVVVSGTVAVFCAETDGGVAVGPRRFLFRVGAGEPLISVPGAPGRRLRLIAVAAAAARLRDVPLATARGRSGTLPAPFVTRIEQWVNRVGRLLTGFEPPVVTRKVEDDGAVALDDGQCLRPASDRVAWMAVERGTVHCMGAAEMPLAAGDGVLPVGSPMWVTAAGAATVRARATNSLTDAAELVAALSHLDRIVLAHLQREALAADDAERRRLQERGRRQAHLTDAALEDLAAVLDPRDVPATCDTSLLTVLTAVGDALGVEIKPPGRSEDMGRVADPLDAIARASRVRTRRVLLSGAWWRQDCGPLVAYSADEERRPLALLQGRRQRYEIFDPVTRERTPVDAATAATLDPEAVMLYRPLPARKLTLWDLVRFSLAGRGRDLAFILMTGTAATLLGMLTPQATALLMDQAIPEANVRLLLELGLALAAAAFGQAVFALAEGVVSMRLGLGTEAASQAAVWDRLLSLKPSFFRKYSSGDLQSRALAANDVGRELNGATLRTIFTSFLALLNLGLLLYYSAKLALIAVVVTAVALAVTASFGAAVRRKIIVLEDLRGAFYGLVIQLVGGVSKLRVAGAEQRAYTTWVRRYTEQLRVMFAAQRLEDYVVIFNGVVPTLGTISLFWFGYGQMLAEGAAKPLSIGTFLAFNAAFGTFLGGATSLSNTIIGMLDTMTRGKRIRPILEAQPEVDPSKSDPGRLAGRVELERIVFRYRDDGPKILDDISLRAEPGEFIALVGPSGSGKSTVFRLLLGFEAPESGAVLFDGQDVAGLDVTAVRRQLGVVLQSGRLNTGSIYDNIACGSLVSLDEAMEAARDAGLESDLAQMPMGLHTVVSEGGGNLSGGQRQRLLIARALVVRPCILLFDEATSALDNRTQSVVGESLARRSVTRIVIAHLLSTVRSASRIYVLDEGCIVQQGTFEELTASEGPFARMMARQMV